MLFEKSGNFFHRVNVQMHYLSDPFIKKESKKHITVKGKHKEEIERNHDNAGAFMHQNIKNTRAYSTPILRSTIANASPLMAKIMQSFILMQNTKKKD